ncbi:MAG: lipase family protein [Cytophagales bacterium]
MKLQLRNFYILFSFAFLVFLFSCSSDENAVSPVDENQNESVLISKDTFSIRSSGDLKLFIEAGLPGFDVSAMKYDAIILKVVYRTKYKGEDINASGLVILPSTTDEVDMLSFQHGTIGSDAEAPSNITLSDQTSLFYAAIASTGMIAVIPDFIGFGASVDIAHPYYVEDLTASATIDNIRAAKEIAELLDLDFNNELYLAGYSQGGYATMATHKWIEEKGLDGFNLIASFPSSGGYDMKGFQEYFFTLETFHQPFYMAYVVNAFKSAYDMSLDFSDIFNEPYASRIPDLFNGQYTGTEINNQLNDTLNVLLKTEAIAGLETDPIYADLKMQLIENSLTDWVPETRMFMYHGTADITVPYQNSIDTYDQLIENGASENIVTFTPLQDATHGTGVIPYIGELTKELTILRN